MNEKVAKGTLSEIRSCSGYPKCYGRMMIGTRKGTINLTKHAGISSLDNVFPPSLFAPTLNRI